MSICASSKPSAQWVAFAKPDVVILAAAKVGGILANDSYPADFLFDNLAIETNVIQAAHLANVERLVFLGSSCIYPKFAPQPIKEEALLTGPLEPTNEGYAIAKIAGIKMCQAYRRQYGRRYISVMPSNLYGQNDNFDLSTSHVLPALVRKFHAATTAGEPEVVVWGTGTPLREFLYVDDLADAVVFLMDRYDGGEPINCGTGTDVSIRAARGDDWPRRRVRRKARLRYRQAGRHATKTDGFKPVGRSRLAAKNKPRRGRYRGLSLVCADPNRQTRSHMRQSSSRGPHS